MAMTALTAPTKLQPHSSKHCISPCTNTLMYTTHITSWTHSNPHDGTDSVWCAEYTEGIRIYKGIMAILHQNPLHTLNTSPARIHTD